MAGDPEANPNPQPSRPRWEALIWPRWLPIPARLPLIAQIAGAIALIAAIAMPRWTAVPPAPAAQPAPATPSGATQPSPPPAPEVVKAPEPPRPAHLNLDVRHNLRSVDLSVTVDGKSVLETKLAGSGKRFGLIGRRAERGFTRTLDLSPGVRVVRVRVRSAEDKFDQTRVERFDLDSASVASLRISAEKSGLSVTADRPPARPAPQAAPAASAALDAQAAPAPATSVPPQAVQLPHAAQAAEAAQSAQEASAVAEVYQSLRSSLIAMAGFIASAATGFLVESFMRTRRALQFAQNSQPASAVAVMTHKERRRRRREGKPPQTPAITSN